LQREIVVERALAVNESPLPLNKLRIIVLMMLWSQGAEPDMLMFDELLLSDDDNTPRLCINRFINRRFLAKIAAWLRFCVCTLSFRTNLG
jgi:hypothetical protein